MNQFLICEFNTCKKYLLNPVILPCGHSVCNVHTQEMTDSFKSIKFKCEMCKKEHELPENGFIVNMALEKMLNSKQHLNSDHKTSVILLEKLEAILKEFDLIYKDPADFVHDYFFNLKNEIEIERERLKLQIDSIALQMIDQLNDFEKECKTKTNKTTHLDQEHKNGMINLKKDMSKWKNELRITEIAVNRVKELTQQLKSCLDENQKEMDKIQSQLLMEKKCFLNIKKLNFTQDIFADFRIEKLPLIESDIFKSNILKNNHSIDLLKLCEFNHDAKFNLIYRATRDGFSSTNFHSKCNEKGKTLTIVKEKDNSYIFGGYTEQSWKGENIYKKDLEAFIFSLINKDNNPIKIKVTKSDNAIFCKSSYGANFGGGDFRISSDSNIMNLSNSILGNNYTHPNYASNSDEAHIFLAGSQYFMTDEIEVYQCDRT